MKLSLILLFILILPGCGEDTKGSMISFTIPKGFIGFFVIHKVAGQSNEHGSSASISIIVPKNGIADVSDLGPFQGWHKEKAVWSDGTYLEAEKHIPGTTVLMCVGGDAQDIYYLVGDPRGIDAWTSAPSNRTLDILNKAYVQLKIPDSNPGHE